MSRSELEVAADTVLALISATVIPTHLRARAMSVAGLMPGDLEDAVRRQRERGFLAPRRDPTVKRTAPPPPEPPPPEPPPLPRQGGGNRGGGRPKRQPPYAATNMVCGRCDQTKPLADFDLRADRPGVRWTVCNACRRERQANRYLSVKKERALSAARIEFVVEPGDGLVGLVCSDCGRDIVAGDIVTGVVEITHAHNCLRS